MTIQQTISEGFTKILSKIEGIKPDEATTNKVNELSTEIESLKAENTQLKEDITTKDTRISELETENTSLKEGKETAESNATQFETELKEAKATIENPDGEIQKQVAAGVQKGIAESGHTPVPDSESKTGGKDGGSELKGLARVKAAWNAK